MAKMVRIENEGKAFTFYCTSRNTRHGFAHDCTLFIDGYEREEASCYYFNRTWECWQYQTVCIDCINKLINNRRESLKEEYKYNNGIKRMTRQKNDIFHDIWQNDEIIKMYSKVYYALSNNQY